MRRCQVMPNFSIVCLLVRMKGSVIPRTLGWSIPCAVAAGVMQRELHGTFEVGGMFKLWSGFTFVLGFCVVFHTNQAYARYWEGSTLIQQVRGEWFNAASSILSFCSGKEEQRKRVEEFQHLLIRLMSMLYCAALQQVATLDDDNFAIIDNSGLEQQSLRWLSQNVDRVEIILSWIQRLIIDSHNEQTLVVAPPLLSRSFQELSRGSVNLNNVKKIKDVPLPFAYVQVTTWMLVINWVMTPLFASQECEHWLSSAMIAFVISSSFWALHFIASEIEQPFGDDENDLPIAEMQLDMNRSLTVLLDSRTQVPPKFNYNRRRDGRMMTRVSDLDMMYSAVNGGREFMWGSEGSEEGRAAAESSNLEPPRILRTSIGSAGSARGSSRLSDRLSGSLTGRRTMSVRFSNTFETAEEYAMEDVPSGSDRDVRMIGSMPGLSVGFRSVMSWKNLPSKDSHFASRLQDLKINQRMTNQQARLRGMLHQVLVPFGSLLSFGESDSMSDSGPLQKTASKGVEEKKKSDSIGELQMDVPREGCVDAGHASTGHDMSMSMSTIVKEVSENIPPDQTNAATHGVNQGGLRMASKGDMGAPC